MAASVTTSSMIEYTPSAPSLVHQRGRAHFEPAAESHLRWTKLLAPLSGALGAALLLAHGHAAQRRAGVAALGAAFGVALARWQYGRLRNWQPPYRVEQRIGRLEVRRYGQEIHAETTIEAASWPEALDSGFRVLSTYLRRGNAAHEELPLTSPVMTTLNAPRAQGHAAAWRAPSVASVERLVGVTSRTMALVMPGSLTLDDLPAPNDDRVQLRVVPARRVAALTFRGRYATEVPAHKRNELLFLAKCAGFSVVSEVTFAGYDAPSTLPFLRRNEVLVEIAD